MLEMLDKKMRYKKARKEDSYLFLLITPWVKVYYHHEKKTRGKKKNRPLKRSLTKKKQRKKKYTIISAT